MDVRVERCSWLHYVGRYLNWISVGTCWVEGVDGCSSQGLLATRSCWNVRSATYATRGKVGRYPIWGPVDFICLLAPEYITSLSVQLPHCGLGW